MIQRVLVPLVLSLIFAACAQNDTIEGVQTFKVAQGHKEGQLTYAQTPPAGGEHNPAWQNCGVYDQPLYDVYAVHSMEHGAVWITYHPDLPASEVDKLRQAAEGRTYVLLSPYGPPYDKAELPAPIVASAWGAQLKLDSAQDPRLAQFIARYEQGPQTPEPGAACSGGFSETR